MDADPFLKPSYNHERLLINVSIAPPLVTIAPLEVMLTQMCISALSAIQLVLLSNV